jgi:membrane dipeptidase
MMQMHQNVIDHRKDPARWAEALGISREAVEIYLAADVIDLHIDTFIWTRIFGYDLTRRHGQGIFGARFYGQADLPRLLEARVTGGIWSITTNPLRRRSRRAPTFQKNLARLKEIFAAVPDHVAICRSASDYRKAKGDGKHAAFVGIQGGNALDTEGAIAGADPDLLIKVTLVHLSTSTLGTTSAPQLTGASDGRLSDLGRDYVRQLNQHRIFLDLAHINRQGFFDALEVHDPSQPFMVSHTGIAGVHKHWRNVDDDQLRALARTGGVCGVMYQSSFLGDHYWGGRAERVVDHLAHIVATIGEDHAALGSDWDGAIITPRDMPTCLELPKLAQLMLDRGWSAERIHKILGGNFLRALAALRP